MVNLYTNLKCDEQDISIIKTPRDTSLKFIRQFARVYSQLKGSKFPAFIVN